MLGLQVEPILHGELELLAGLPEDFHGQVLDPFLTILEAQLVELETAIQERNLQAVQNLAHKVKGANRNLGFTGLASLAEDMEKEAKRGNLATLDQVGALRREVRAVQEYIAVKRDLPDQGAASIPSPENNGL